MNFFKAQNRLVLLLLPAILMAGTILRFDGLGRESFWFNEAASYYFAKGSPGEVIRHSFSDETNPPGFHLLIHFWQKIAGTSEGALRLPSALAGSFSIALMYFFARRFLGRAGSLAAAALLALSPLHVWYSQECRAYAIWLLLILCAYLSFFKWLETRKPIFAALNALFVLLACSFHYFGIHVILIENLYLADRRDLWRDRRSLRQWALSQGALALALVPLGLMLLRVDRTHVSWWQESAVRWQVIKSIIFQLNGVYYFLTPELPLKIMMLLLCGAALAASLFALGRRGTASFLLIALGLPVALNLGLLPLGFADPGQLAKRRTLFPPDPAALPDPPGGGVGISLPEGRAPPDRPAGTGRPACS